MAEFDEDDIVNVTACPEVRVTGDAFVLVYSVDVVFIRGSLERMVVEPAVIERVGPVSLVQKPVRLAETIFFPAKPVVVRDTDVGCLFLAPICTIVAEPGQLVSVEAQDTEGVHVMPPYERLPSDCCHRTFELPLDALRIVIV